MLINNEFLINLYTVFLYYLLQSFYTIFSFIFPYYLLYKFILFYFLRLYDHIASKRYFSLTSTRNSHLSALAIYPKRLLCADQRYLHAHTCVPHAKHTHTLAHRQQSDTPPPTGGGCGAHLFESVKRAALHIVGHTSRQVRTSFSALGAIGRNGWLSVS